MPPSRDIAAHAPSRHHLAHSALARFEPLERVISFDDFDRGTCGWTAHIGNYEGTLDTLLSAYADLRPAQLSNLTMWDVGSMGAMDGTYALKLATRPTPGHMSILIKRQTWRELADVRFEAYLAYKPEASELVLGELDVRAFGVGFDLQDDVMRWMPQYRFFNAHGGVPAAGGRTEQASRVTPRGTWQHRTETSAFRRIGGSGSTVSHWHLADEGWSAIPGGEQVMCYNEIPTKVNWFYLRIDLDLAGRTVRRLQCNDLVLEHQPLRFIEFPAMPNLRGMLNAFFWVQTDTAKRALLYVDSAVLSTSAAG
jgi:hypothetical protein